MVVVGTLVVMVEGFHGCVAITVEVPGWSTGEIVDVAAVSTLVSSTFRNSFDVVIAFGVVDFVSVIVAELSTPIASGAFNVVITVGAVRSELVSIVGAPCSIVVTVPEVLSRVVLALEAMSTSSF